MLVLSHIEFVRRGWRLAGETFGVRFISLSLRLTRLKDAELEVTAVCVSNALSQAPSHIGSFNAAASDNTTSDTVIWTGGDSSVESIRDNDTTSERGEQTGLNLLQLLRGAVLDWLVSVVQSTEIEHAKASVEN